MTSLLKQIIDSALNPDNVALALRRSQPIDIGSFPAIRQFEAEAKDLPYESALSIDAHGNPRGYYKGHETRVSIKNYREPDVIGATHNHPTASPLSQGDINTAINSGGTIRTVGSRLVPVPVFAEFSPGSIANVPFIGDFVKQEIGVLNPGGMRDLLAHRKQEFVQHMLNKYGSNSISGPAHELEKNRWMRKNLDHEIHGIYGQVVGQLNEMAKDWDVVKPDKSGHLDAYYKHGNVFLDDVVSEAMIDNQFKVKRRNGDTKEVTKDKTKRVLEEVLELVESGEL